MSSMRSIKDAELFSQYTPKSYRDFALKKQSPKESTIAVKVRTLLIVN